MKLTFTFLLLVLPAFANADTVNRSYSCVAVDALGHRFTASSFIPGQARRAALMICERSRRLPRERGCTIESCGRAGEDDLTAATGSGEE